MKAGMGRMAMGGSKRYRVAVGLAVLAVAGLARAEIYVCEDNGKKTFSQQPCGANAKPVELQQQAGRIMLPEQFDARAAADICKIVVRSWEVAAQMSRQNIAFERANERVFGYLRERVVNFDEVVKRNPQVFTVFQQASRNVTRGAYSRPTIRPGELEAAVDECTQTVTRDLDRLQQSRQRQRSSTTM